MTATSTAVRSLVRAMLLIVVATTLVSCASRRGAGMAPPDSTPEIPSDIARAAAVTTEALLLRGTPYRAGGSAPIGFDCSGFTRYVFGQHGVPLPRRAQDQYHTGSSVASAADVRRGDLVFFTMIAPGPSHVGLALDNDRFIHAPSERGEVRIEFLSSQYWRRRYVGARRIVEVDDLR